MALIYMNGFESGLATGFDWQTAGISVSSTTFRSGGYCCLFGSGVTGQVWLTPALSELYLQFAWKHHVGRSTGFDMITWIGTDGEELGVLYLDAANVFKLYTGDRATLRATGTIDVSSIGLWYLTELRLKIDDSNGVLALRINGVDDCSFTGDTQPASINQISAIYFYYSGIYNLGLDDVVINDISGSVNNSWVGGMRIGAIRPSAAGDRTELSPSTGSNYQCVDEVPVSETDYVSGNSNGLGDLYTLADVDSTIRDVRGVQVKGMVRKHGVSSVANVKTVIKIGGTEYKSAAIPVSTNLDMVSKLYELNPNSGVLWTPTDLNNLQAGQEVLT